MKKLLLITIATALVTGATGCGSILARNDKALRPAGLYPGVKVDKEIYNGGHGGSIGGVFNKPISVVDFPFSFALDTALLPIDILGSIFKGKDDKPSEPEAPQSKPAPQP